LLEYDIVSTIWAVEISIEIYKKAEEAGKAEEDDSLLRTVKNILTIEEENYINRYYAGNRRSEFSFLIFIIFSHISSSLLKLILDNWNSEYRSVSIFVNNNILYTPLNTVSLIRSAEEKEKRKEDEEKNIFWYK
jgi:hypothetical protein